MHLTNSFLSITFILLIFMLNVHFFHTAFQGGSTGRSFLFIKCRIAWMQHSFIYFLYDDNCLYLVLNILFFLNIPQKHSNNE